MIKINRTVKEGTISVSKAGVHQKPWGGFYLQERWGGWWWLRAFMAEGTQACVWDVHSTFGKPEVGLLGWGAGQMAGDEAGAAWLFWVSGWFKNVRTHFTYFQLSLGHHGRLKDCWGALTNVFAVIHVQPTSAAIRSFFTICIPRSIVTVSIQHLGTSVPVHA